MSDFPKTAQAVIIGGGIIGCSTAYHLAKLGWDVVLLERKKMTSGTTFHAAGLVGQLRSNANITQLLGYSVELYKTLEEETGQATGWKMNGGLRLACNAERWTEVKRQATTAHSFGLDMQLLTPKEAQDLWPLMAIDDVIGAAYLPTDGQANPSDITLSLAKGARMAGARIFEDTKVLSVDVEKGIIKGVETEKGRIDCSVVVACCGQWTRSFAKTVGVNVPLVSMEHQYMITERIEGVASGLPTLRDPDRLTYYKEDVGGLVMGGYEPNPIPWAQSGIPQGFHYSLLDSNFDHFEQIMEQALARVPALETAGVKELVNGPESFTPDGNFILGEAPELKNFFVGAGFNAFGIAAGGGAGMALAEWVAKGEPPFDLWPVDIRRFGRVHFDDDWIRTRTVEAYSKHYTMAWPSEEHNSGRPFRTSPLYETLKADGAVFGEKLGWERPNWYADTNAGEEQRDIYTFERPNWHTAVAREHKAAREAAVLFDQTSFAKFTLKGPDAEAALGWITANDVAKPVGSLIYTQMLNDHGGIECDLTCARIATDEYYIVTGTGFATHDFDWISRNIPDGMDAKLADLTTSNAVLSLMGPKSRDILQAVTADDISNTAFRFGSVKHITIAGCSITALRVTYVGELGWELHFPAEHAKPVYNALHSAGLDHGLINAGYRAIETLRLEKGYRAWGADIGPDHTPDEAGLGWAVKLKKNIDFKGRQAVEKQRAKGVPKMLATFIAEVGVFEKDDLSAKSGSRLAPTKLFPEFSFKSPVLYRISGNDDIAVFLVGSERHVGTEVVELDSNTFRRVVIRPGKGTGLSNFTRYFSTPALFRSIGNSVFIAVLSTIITVSLAFWFAYALSRSCMKYKGFFRLVAMAPILVPSLLPGIALIYLFGNQGILKAFLMGNSIYGPIGIVVGSVFFTFPHAMLIIGTALSISDGRLYEAATALRASKWRTFWTVTIPSARYGLISAAFVVFNLVITDFGLPKVIGGQFNVLAVDIYKQVIGQQNFEMGAVVSVVLLLPAILAFAIDRYNQKKQVAGISARSVVFEPKPNPKADRGWLIYCSLVATFILGIIGICQYAALIKFWPYDLSLSLNNYAFNKMDGGGWAAYSNSIKLGLLTAFFGTIIVFMGAYVVEKTKDFHKSRALFQMLAMMPMAIPGMVLGLAYIFFFNNPANPLNFIYGTMAILVVSAVTHFYTVSHLTALTALKQMDPEFESVAASLKQPFFKLFGRVTVPVCMPAILNISIYLFVNAMTTVSAVVFLYSTDTALASVAVLNMDDAGDIAPAAAMGMMIFYTNAGARLLHLFGSRLILKRSNAWRTQ